jgi:hypothetical protein
MDIEEVGGDEAEVGGDCNGRLKKGAGRALTQRNVHIGLYHVYGARFQNLVTFTEYRRGLDFVNQPIFIDFDQLPTTFGMVATCHCVYISYSLYFQIFVALTFLSNLITHLIQNKIYNYYIF